MNNYLFMTSMNNIEKGQAFGLVVVFSVCIVSVRMNTVCKLVLRGRGGGDCWGEGEMGWEIS